MAEPLYPKPDQRQHDVSLEERTSSWRDASCLLGFSIVWCAIAFTVTYFVLHGRPPVWWTCLFVLFPVVGVALLIAGLVMVVRAALLSYRFGKAGAVVSLLPAYPGETVRVAAAQILKTDTPINSATLELRCDEWVRWQRGTDTYTETRTVFKDSRLFDESAITNGHVRLVGEFSIPPDAMHSFHAKNNRIQWILSFHVDVPGWPDPKHEFVYLVAPRRAVETISNAPSQPAPVQHYPEKAAVSIELEPGRFGDAYRYHLGDRISGTVTVSTRESLGCRGVYVQLGWQTSGKGDPDEEVVWQEYVHHGPLPAGENKFRFQATLPDGPASYDGDLLAINWYVRAWVDLAWARDPGCALVVWAEMPPAS